MNFPSLFAGSLLQRDNRFRVSVLLDGDTVRAHLANSGRLKNLLQPGACVWVSVAGNPNRKTTHDLVLVQHGKTLVSVDASLPPILFGEALRGGKITGISRISNIEYEVPFGNSRLDLRLQDEAGWCWVETKSITLVQDGSALFPDAPTVRGRKHLGALVKAVEEGHRAAVVFVVQRGDAVRFQPNHAVDPQFAVELAKASDAGVQVRAVICEVALEGIFIKNEIEVCFA